MPKLETRCQDCDGVVTADCGQSVVDGMLRWYVSYRCAKCGGAIEVDGNDGTPSEIRDAVIAETGEWEMYRSSTHNNVARLAKSLRKILGWSIADAAQLTKEEMLPFYHGTRPEVEWVSHALERDGIESNAVVIQQALSSL